MEFVPHSVVIIQDSGVSYDLASTLDSRRIDRSWSRTSVRIEIDYERKGYIIRSNMNDLVTFLTPLRNLGHAVCSVTSIDVSPDTVMLDCTVLGRA